MYNSLCILEVVVKQRLQNQKAVRISSRVYADTYEECVDLFNYLVDEKVEWFLESADGTKKDLIEKIDKENTMKDRLYEIDN